MSQNTRTIEGTLSRLQSLDIDRNLREQLFDEDVEEEEVGDPFFGGGPKVNELTIKVQDS